MIRKANKTKVYFLNFDFLYAPSTSIVIKPDDVVVVSKTQLLPNLLRDLGSPSTINFRDDLLLPIHVRKTCLGDGANHEATY